MVLEGVSAVESIRKMVGSTEPKSALPGTIRGDFAQHSYALADGKGVGIKKYRPRFRKSKRCRIRNRIMVHTRRASHV